MSGLKLVTIVCTVILYLNLQINATEPVTYFINKQWTTNYQNYKPNIVKVKDQIIVVGLRNDTITLTSVNDVEINTCKFSVSTPGIIVYPLLTGFAVALGNGKIVIRTFTRLENKRMRSRLRYYYREVFDLFIIVDPHDCSKTKTLEVNKNGFSQQFECLVPYHDTFDLFFSDSRDAGTRNEMSKTPQRFNDQAEPVLLDHQFGFETDIWGFHIETIKPYDASKGYVCTLVSKIDGTMKLKRLDSKFQLVKETEIKPWANGFSAAFDKVSLCYIRSSIISRTAQRQNDTEKIVKLSTTCDFYDIKDLNHLYSVRFFETDSTNDETPIGVVNLPDGGTVVALSSHCGKGCTTNYYLQRINVYGNKKEAINIGTQARNFYGKLSLVSLAGGQVCLIDEGKIMESDYKFKNTSISIKCVDMSK